jgi:hypothetical protein
VINPRHGVAETTWAVETEIGSKQIDRDEGQSRHSPISGFMKLWNCAFDQSQEPGVACPRFEPTCVYRNGIRQCL